MDESIPTYKDTKIFLPNIKKACVIKVYDGDTFTIACKLNEIKDDSYFRFSVRLKNIDTPEIKSKDEKEKKAAINAKNELSNKILNKWVELKNISYDKYGRILADVIYENENISCWLLKNKLGVYYNGGKKKKLIVD